jgi:hypothetical protein
MKIKIINGEYKGMIVDTYYIFSNGIDFVTKNGLVFIAKGDYVEC